MLKTAEENFSNLWHTAKDIECLTDKEMRVLIRSLVSSSWWLLKCLEDLDSQLQLQEDSCKHRYRLVRDDIEFEKRLTVVNFLKEKVLGIKVKF